MKGPFSLSFSFFPSNSSSRFLPLLFSSFLSCRFTLARIVSSPFTLFYFFPKSVAGHLIRTSPLIHALLRASTSTFWKQQQLMEGAVLIEEGWAEWWSELIGGQMLVTGARINMPVRHFIVRAFHFRLSDSLKPCEMTNGTGSTNGEGDDILPGRRSESDRS